MEGNAVDLLHLGSYVRSTNPLPVTYAAPTNVGSATNLDAFGRMRFSQPVTLFDSFYRYRDNGQFSYSSNNTGSTTFNSDQACVKLNVGPGSGAVYRESSRVFAYQPGKSLLILQSFTFAQLTPGLRQRVGYFDAANGIYFQASEDTLSFVRRSSVGGSLSELTVSQPNWNYDSLDGNGPSGIVLNTAATQILFIDIEWLGVGTVRAGFVINGAFHVCHLFHHANLSGNTLPYMSTACLPLRAELETLSPVGGQYSAAMICSTVISEGGYELRGKSRCLAWPILDVPFNLAAKNTLYPVISIRLKQGNMGAVVLPSNIHLVSTTVSIYRWVLTIGSTISGGGAWQSAGADTSVEYKMDATSTITDGTIVKQGLFSATGPNSPSISLDGDVFRFQLERNTFAGVAIPLTLAVSSDNQNNKVIAAIDWEEIT